MNRQPGYPKGVWVEPTDADDEENLIICEGTDHLTPEQRLWPVMRLRGTAPPAHPLIDLLHRIRLGTPALRGEHSTWVRENLIPKLRELRLAVYRPETTPEQLARYVDDLHALLGPLGGVELLPEAPAGRTDPDAPLVRLDERIPNEIWIVTRQIMNAAGSSDPRPVEQHLPQPTSPSESP